MEKNDFGSKNIFSILNNKYYRQDINIIKHPVVCSYHLLDIISIKWLYAF